MTAHMAGAVSLEIGSGFDSILKNGINEWKHAEKMAVLHSVKYDKEKHRKGVSISISPLGKNIGGQEALAAWSCQLGMEPSANLRR